MGNASARIPAVREWLLGPSGIVLAALLLPQRPEEHPPQDVLRHSEYGPGRPREQVKRTKALRVSAAFRPLRFHAVPCQGWARVLKTLRGFQRTAWKGNAETMCVFKPGLPPSRGPSFLLLSFLLMKNLQPEFWLWEEMKNWRCIPKCLLWVCHSQLMGLWQVSQTTKSPLCYL